MCILLWLIHINFCKGRWYCDTMVIIFLVATFYTWVLITEVQQYVAFEFSSMKLAQLILLAVLIFAGFFVLAYNHSLKEYKKVLTVNIYTIDGGKPIENVSLLKVNDTNVRFLEGQDKHVIMNRDRIERIEILRSANSE